MRFAIGQTVVVGSRIAEVGGVRCEDGRWLYLLKFPEVKAECWLGDWLLMSIEEWKLWLRCPWATN